MDRQSVVASRVLLIWLFMGVVASTPATALDPTRAIVQLFHRAYTRDDGLPGPVNAIAQTARAKVDIRSESNERMDSLVELLNSAVESARDQENQRASGSRARSWTWRLRALRLRRACSPTLMR